MYSNLGVQWRPDVTLPQTEDLSDYRGLHLFYDPNSNCAQRVLLLLGEKGLPFNRHEISLMKSEQLSPEYLRLNPKGQVPTLVHDGVSLPESCAILAFLENTYPDPSFTPMDRTKAATMKEWVDLADAFHFDGIKNYLYSHGLGRLPRPEDMAVYETIPHLRAFHHGRLEGKVASDKKAAIEFLNKRFGQLEKALARGPWLAGDVYSLADIAWFPNTIVLRMMGYSFNAFPNVKGWIKRIEARPAYQSHIAPGLSPLPGWAVRRAMRLVAKTGGRR